MEGKRKGTKEKGRERRRKKRKEGKIKRTRENEKEESATRRFATHKKRRGCIHMTKSETTNRKPRDKVTHKLRFVVVVIFILPTFSRMCMRRKEVLSGEQMRRAGGSEQFPRVRNVCKQS